MNIERQSYGVLAAFESRDKFVRALHQVIDQGYSAVDTFTPEPVEGVNQGHSPSGHYVLLIAVVGAGIGMAAGCMLRLHMAPPFVTGAGLIGIVWSFLPLVGSMGLLFALVAAVLGLFLKKDHRPQHPVFSASELLPADQDRFFVFVSSTDEQFDEQETRDLFRQLEADDVRQVPLQ